MELRSGKVVISNKTKEIKTKEIKTKKSKNKKTQTDLQNNIINVAQTFLDFNQKIKSVPKDLQEDCENYIKKIILESFRKGINIKFGNKFNKKHNINL